MKEPRFSEEGSLDRFENKLFNPRTKTSDITLHHGLSSENTKDEIPMHWDGDSTIVDIRKSSGHSVGFYLLVSSLIILLLTLIFASWNILQKRNIVSSANIDVVLNIKPFIEGGEDSPLTITIQNRNSVSLVDSNLTLSYEKGVGGQDQKEKINNKIKLGNIKQNEIRNNDENIQLYGSEGESKTIRVVLDYKVAGSNAVYTKEVTEDVILKTPPVSIHVEGPDSIASSQISRYTISVRNNNLKIEDNILVKATFPESFTVLSTSLENKAGNINAWVFSGLTQGEERVIVVEGSAKASIGEHLNIKTQAGSQVGDSYDIGTVYSFDLKDIVISGGDLKFTFKTETDSGKVSSLRFGNKVKVSLNYENISGRALDSVEIKGILSGDSFDPSSVVAKNGEYSLNNKAIIWNKFTAPELTNVLAGAKGILEVTFDVSQTGNDKPFIRFDVQGSSVGADSANRDIKTNISKTWQIQGETSLTTQTIYVGSSFLNKGPIPPHVGIPTTYTLRLSVSSHNILKKGTASFNLPSYVSWLNNVTGEGVVYSTGTRTVVWDVGILAAEQSRSIEMQVSVIPVQSHLGTSPLLTSGINFSSSGDMNRRYNIINKSLTTELSDEETVSDKWIVVEK